MPLQGIFTDLPWIEIDTIDDYARAKDIEHELFEYNHIGHPEHSPFPIGSLSSFHE